MNCKFCHYEWKERIDNPKSCPRCKSRFDHLTKDELPRKIDED